MHAFQHSSDEARYALVFSDGEYERLDMPDEVTSANFGRMSSVVSDVLAPVGNVLASSATDRDLLANMLTSILSVHGVSHALVGELCGADWNAVQTVSVVSRNGVEENFQYDLSGTPCSEVLGRTRCVYPSNVADLFPDDVLLAQMGIECYVGLPVYDDGGRPLGLMIVMDQRPLEHSRIQSVIYVLRRLSPLVRRVLESRRRAHDMNMLLKVSRSEDLSSLVLNLATVLMTRGAFMLSLKGAAEQGALTFSLNGRVEEREGVSLRPELLGRIRGGDLKAAELFIGHIASGVDEVWPQACQYNMVCPLFDRFGEVMGLAGVFHDSPLNPRLIHQPFIESFASHAAFRLEESLYMEQRSQAERRLRELERLESLGVLMGGVTHDFNNVISGVVGNAEYLMDVSQDTFQTDDVMEALVDIREAANSASALCKQLMSYAGRSTSDTEIFSLNGEVKAVARLAHASLGVSCPLDIVLCAEDLQICGDPLQIRQVVMNLLTNAQEAVADDGLLTLTIVTERLTEQRVMKRTGSIPPGDYMVLTVTDNGCGIPEEIQARMFDPFFTTKSLGHGLGLASVLEIVRNHAGGLDVHSIVDEGTRISVYLPVHSVNGGDVLEPHAAEPLSESEEPQRDRLKVLVVDDDEFIRGLLQRFCERANFDIVLAETGESGVLEYETQQDIDFVILDMKMPGMNGLEVLERLKLINSEVKVVMSSGHRADFGDLPVLPKPYSYQSFLDVVTELVPH